VVLDTSTSGVCRTHNPYKVARSKGVPMSESQSGSEALLSEIRHIGVVVRDVEETAKYFAEKLGVSFTVREREKSGTLRGAPMKYKAKLAHAPLGAVTLELLQTVEGTAHFDEFLATHGEGIHHIAIGSPEPLDAEIEKWQRRGVQPVQIDRTAPGEGTAYMDVPGCMVELLCNKRYR